MTRLRADLLLLLAAGIWGLAFIFQKTAMGSIGPFTFIAARGTVAAATLLPLALFEYRPLPEPVSQSKRQPRFPLDLLGAAILAGLAFFAGAALQQLGLQTATATNAGFLTALYVVFTPPLAYVMRGIRPGRVILPAVLMSALGTWLLGGGTFPTLSRGDWLIATCAGFWALHVILSQDGANFGRPILFTGLQFCVVALVAAACAVIFEAPTIDGLRAAAGEIAYVGLLSSALTFTILTAALRSTPAAEAAVIISMESLFAAMAGALLLHERLGLLAWSGCAFILGAVLLVQLSPRRPSETVPAQS